jgi:hypothetical protein
LSSVKMATLGEKEVCAGPEGITKERCERGHSCRATGGGLNMAFGLDRQNYMSLCTLLVLAIPATEYLRYKSHKLDASQQPRIR